MRLIIAILSILFLGLQLKLWMGEGNVLQWLSLNKKIKLEQDNNERLAAHNKALALNVIQLKKNEQALEERARFELGMIKKNETYYQLIE